LPSLPHRALSQHSQQQPSPPSPSPHAPLPLATSQQQQQREHAQIHSFLSHSPGLGPSASPSNHGSSGTAADLLPSLSMPLSPSPFSPPALTMQQQQQQQQHQLQQQQQHNLLAALQSPTTPQQHLLSQQSHAHHPSESPAPLLHAPLMSSPEGPQPRSSDSSFGGGYMQRFPDPQLAPLLLMPPSPDMQQQHMQQEQQAAANFQPF